MTLKLQGGVYALKASGLPEEIAGAEELMQNIRLRLNLPLGSFAYGRTLGSRLHTLNRAEEHADKRAVALANEALLQLPGVRMTKAVLRDAGKIDFTVATPFGERTVTYGEI